MKILRAIVSFIIGLLAASVSLVVMLKVTTLSVPLTVAVEWAVWIAVGVAWYHRERVAAILKRKYARARSPGSK